MKSITKMIVYVVHRTFSCNVAQMPSFKSLIVIIKHPERRVIICQRKDTSQYSGGGVNDQVIMKNRFLDYFILCERFS